MQKMDQNLNSPSKTATYFRCGG